ncbi:MAG TPA: hypothetical protein VFV66_11375 [Nonomuraea sp.]|nr:hypothetical protein [Nonomuraea sp.]
MDANTAKCTMCDGRPVNEYNTAKGQTKVLLCQEHDDVTRYPKKWCDGCPAQATLLVVGERRQLPQITMTVEPSIVAAHPNPNPYSRLRFCVPCSAATTCLACASPAVVHDLHTPLRGAALLGDNDPRCAYCALAPVTDARPHVQMARDWVRDWFKSRGETYPQDVPITVDLVKPDVLKATAAKATESGTLLGVCTCTMSSGKPHAYAIQALHGMRRVTLLETLVHELTHVWVYQNNLAYRVYVEGFCNFVALSFLEWLGGHEPAAKEEAERRMALMRENPDKYYGGDMRALTLQAKSPAFNACKYLRDSLDNAPKPKK